VCHNGGDDDGVIIHASEGRTDDACYERFDAAVKRLWDLEVAKHTFRMPADYDFSGLHCISCEEFEQYVDDLANGKEASL
jgi:hypothetical protein